MGTFAAMRCYRAISQARKERRRKEGSCCCCPRSKFITLEEKWGEVCQKENKQSNRTPSGFDLFNPSRPEKCIESDWKCMHERKTLLEIVSSSCNLHEARLDFLVSSGGGQSFFILSDFSFLCSSLHTWFMSPFHAASEPRIFIRFLLILFCLAKIDVLLCTEALHFNKRPVRKRNTFRSIFWRRPWIYPGTAWKIFHLLFFCFLSFFLPLLSTAYFLFSGRRQR